MTLSLFALSGLMAALTGAPLQDSSSASPQPVPYDGGSIAMVPTLPDRVLGDPSAPVALTIYSSFICPDCADWHQTVLPQIKARFVDSGEVRIVFRDLPTNPFEFSGPAAALGRCVPNDKFWDVAAVLMDGQKAVREDGPVSAWYDAAIAVSGSPRAEIEACVANPDTLAAIRAEAAQSQSEGVTRVPAASLDGTVQTATDVETLSAAIEAALASQRALPAPAGAATTE